MPELPEVETVKRTLNTLVKGKVIESVDIIYPGIIKGDITAFKETTKGATIYNIERRGKFLLFDLGDYYLLSHLRMEGKYFLKPLDAAKNKHEHIIFRLEHGETLRYHDVRKFGTMEIKNKQAVFHEPPLSLLGREPIDPSFDSMALYRTLKAKKKAIKTALLDQHIISGLGNIYVDETLFCAHIHPEKLTYKITKKEAQTLSVCAKNVLEKAVALGGSSIRSYTNSLGITGRFQTKLRVHLKKGEPCPQCETEIKKIKVNGRGTYFCKHCQKR